MVLGMSATGKHTLMQRLEGKEPDFTTRETRRRKHHHRTGSVNTNESPSSVASGGEPRVATAPYQAPPNMPTWDNDRIQLRVQTGRKVISKHHAVDFYVLLVDPRQDRKKVEKYLTKTLSTALRAQGYGGTKDASTTAQQHPFCLCLLRNFRDLLPEDDDDDDNGVANTISESDLTSWTLQILQDQAPDLADPVLQCCNTSLLNCYGLGLLHNFIYQAYVQRKRLDLEQRLRQIQQAQSRAQSAAAAVSYAEYCAQVEQLVVGRNDDETTATTATSSGGGVAQQRPGKMVPSVQQPHSVAAAASRGRAESGESSSTLPSSAQPSLVNAKDALEAFLESDSDDSGDDGSVQNDENDDSSDDADAGENDEEDFYYDESGVRYEAGHPRQVDACRDSEDEKPADVVPTKEAQVPEKKSVKIEAIEDRSESHEEKDDDSDADEPVSHEDERASEPSPRNSETSPRKSTDASLDDAESMDAKDGEHEECY